MTYLNKAVYQKKVEGILNSLNQKKKKTPLNYTYTDTVVLQTTPVLGAMN